MTTKKRRQRVKVKAQWAIPSERQVERALTRPEQFAASSFRNETGRNRLAVLDLVLEKEGLAGADPRLLVVWNLVQQQAKEQLRQLLVTQAVMMSLGEAEGDNRMLSFLLCNWWRDEFQAPGKDAGVNINADKVLIVRWDGNRDKGACGALETTTPATG